MHQIQHFFHYWNTTGNDVLELHVGSVTVPEFQGHPTYDILVAAISFWDKQKSKGVYQTRNLSHIFSTQKLLHWQRSMNWCTFIEVLPSFHIFSADLLCHTLQNHSVLILVNHFAWTNKFLMYNAFTVKNSLQHALVFQPYLPRLQFPQFIHQPTYALNKIKFKTSVKLLHVSALGCHHQGVNLQQRSSSPIH
jgi:hypothetical protein